MKNPHAEQPFYDLTSFDVQRETIRKLPEGFCRKRQVVLLEDPDTAAGELVALGMLDVADDRAAAAVEKRIPVPIRRVQLNAFELDRALAIGFDGGPKRTGEREPLALAEEFRIEFAPRQAISKMVADTLSEAVRRRASDVHMETYPDDVDVRFRIDGVLHQVPTPISPRNVKKAVAFLKVMADLDITENRRDQDGGVPTVYRGADGNARQIDMRLSVLPGPYGSDVVLRILDTERIRIPLGELGLAPDQYRAFRELLDQPGGLILVAGPTASGKTTTLYASVHEMNSDANKILSVEDPIEYRIPKVNQKQIGATMSFADYARAFMRQNPDVLLIGEVRDEETAAITLRAAQMGHLVLTTLHARDAATALARILVLGGDTSMVAHAVIGVLSQRLLRRVCDGCAKPVDGPDARPTGTSSGRRGTGCPACRGTGYRGQVGVFELLRMNRSMQHAVATTGRLPENSRPPYRCMIDHAEDLVKRGVTTMDEVLRNVPSPPHNDPERRA